MISPWQTDGVGCRRRVGRPPEGWAPSEQWSPDPAWPAPPSGWQWWRLEPRQRPGIGLLLLGALLAASVGVVTAAELAWSYRQPMSTNTITPALHAFAGLDLGSAVVGLVMAFRGAVRQVLAVAAATVAASGIAAFIAVVVVGLAQPCAATDSCDIDAAPTAVIAFMVVALTVGALLFAGVGVGLVVQPLYKGRLSAH